MTDVVGYLKQRGFVYNLRGDEAVLNCPFCDDTKQHFAVNILSGAFNCMRGTCGVQGSFFELKRRLGDTPVSYVEKTYRKPKSVSGQVSEKILQWFEGRGIQKKTVELFGIRQKGSYR